MLFSLLLKLEFNEKLLNSVYNIVEMLSKLFNKITKFLLHIISISEDINSDFMEKLFL